LTEVQQECYQDPQNLVTGSFTWLLLSHSLIEDYKVNHCHSQNSCDFFFFFFLKATQIKKDTTAKETYTVMLSQKISNTQNCEKFRNFKRSVVVPNTAVPEIYIPKWTTRTEGLEKNILTWHLNAPLLWKQWN